MPNLVSITFVNPPGIPGVRSSALNTIRVGERNGPLAGWQVRVRGELLLFTSPPGWKASQFDHVEPGVRRAFEVPRRNACLEWELADGEDAEPIRDWTQPDPVAASAAQEANDRLLVETVAREEADRLRGLASFAEDGDEPIVEPARRGPGRPRKTVQP